MYIIFFLYEFSKRFENLLLNNFFDEISQAKTDTYQRNNGTAKKNRYQRVLTLIGYIILRLYVFHHNR